MRLLGRICVWFEIPPCWATVHRPMGMIGICGYKTKKRRQMAAL
ncbi:hypothetical protein RB2083_2545 [Rhodobacteraceae bacterium HTCC2083]|nr:hypothetical protein RB2083_2545 [Rhodobacteraceae bacterium HTCC2083]